MDLFTTLEQQSSSVRLPLFAVTVTAAAQVNTPLLGILHWHGFRRTTPLVLPGVEIPLRPAPASAIWLDVQWRRLEAVDAMLLDAAWRSGAWELERIEQRACGMIGATAAEAMACRQAFGDYGEDARRDPQFVGQEDGREALLQLAARKGYVRWLFRPVKGGLWHALSEPDETLEADGGRRLPCPVQPTAQKRAARHIEGPCRRTVYRLGKVNRLILQT